MAIIDFNEESGNAVVEELGENARFIRANVVNYDDMVKAFDETFKLWGQIDFVYANAVRDHAVILGSQKNWEY